MVDSQKNMAHNDRLEENNNTTSNADSWKENNHGTPSSGAKKLTPGMLCLFKDQTMSLKMYIPTNLSMRNAQSPQKV